ncbi:hypothetical protein UFOVP1119_40 [uncultured Caudovirales phage]|uniref:Uncharacterized protein n=1 Tax=uncultured Caudovirales phage TaxID=2100421 RepID=A0A6J5RBA2_9CAUD|nr:hypothetical protein UFOVP1119_40 [uncultured Caudovirales phage]CAB4193082.1 hypothetical protein UFOVP1238_14 [uncultured Caudovirales phage]
MTYATLEALKADQDLQDQTRMQDTYRDIEDIIDKISVLPVGQPLVWVYVWDVVRQLWTDIMEGQEEEYCTAMDLDEVWELFWLQADVNGFTLEYGTEDLYEAVREWMIDSEIIDEAVDEDEDDMIESEKEEV